MTFNVPEKLQPAASGAETPVSYTHLRAHETVLDLVCRLLLEKKKNTVAQSTTLYQDSTKNTSETI